LPCDIFLSRPCTWKRFTKDTTRRPKNSMPSFPWKTFPTCLRPDPIWSSEPSWRNFFLVLCAHLVLFLRFFFECCAGSHHFGCCHRWWTLSRILFPFYPQKSDAGFCKGKTFPSAFGCSPFPPPPYSKGCAGPSPHAFRGGKAKVFCPPSRFSPPFFGRSSCCGVFLSQIVDLNT